MVLYIPGPQIMIIPNKDYSWIKTNISDLDLFFYKLCLSDIFPKHVPVLSSSVLYYDLYNMLPSTFSKYL